MKMLCVLVHYSNVFRCYESLFPEMIPQTSCSPRSPFVFVGTTPSTQPVLVPPVPTPPPTNV